MSTFFKIASVVRMSYKVIRAAAGIIIVAHAMWVWFGRRFSKNPKTVRTT
jgi:hypothetical protein